MRIASSGSSGVQCTGAASNGERCTSQRQADALALYIIMVTWTAICSQWLLASSGERLLVEDKTNRKMPFEE